MKNKVLALLTVTNLLLFGIYLSGFTNPGPSSSTTDLSDKIIKVRGIVVVDSLGIERAILASHLPEPNFADGNRHLSRGKNGSVSGLMLFDAEGQERGGYVTDDNYGNAFLTLDSKTTQGMLLLAEPQGSMNMQIFSQNGKNKVSLEADNDGANIKLKSRDRDIKIYKDEK